MSGDFLAELLDFCREHPVPRADPERFLRHLASVPEALVDLRARGWLGVILDRARDREGATPFEWVGANAATLEPETARIALAEIAARARALGVPQVDILMTPHWAGAEGSLRQAGAIHAYHDWDMTHADGEWGPEVAIPTGWRWVGYTDDLAERYLDLLQRSFDSQKGFYMPATQDLLRGLAETAKGTRLLFDEAGEARALIRLRIERRYIHAIARDPKCRGRGLGRMAMDEARRVLGPGPIWLSTVKENNSAAALYRKLGFTLEVEYKTWALPTGQLSD